VLVSGDIDFIGKLNDLRYQAGFNVLLIHNRAAKQELIKVAHRCWLWSDICQPLLKVKASPSTSSHNYSCRTCRATFSTRSSLQQHLNDTKHYKSASEPKSTTTRATLEQQSTFNTNLSCPSCESIFVNIDALQQHQEAKAHYLDCPTEHCNRAFFTRESLLQHQQMKVIGGNTACPSVLVCFRAQNRWKIISDLNIDLLEMLNKSLIQLCCAYAVP